MAYLNIGSVEDVGGGGSFSFDFGAAPDVAIVGVQSYWDVDTAVVTIGGTTATKLCSEENGIFHTALGWWAVENPAWNGSQTVTVTNGDAVQYAIAYGLQVNGTATIGGAFAGGGAATDGRLALDSGDELAIRFIAGVSNSGWFGSALATTTDDGNWNNGSKYGHFGHGTDYFQSGEVTVGWNGRRIGAMAGFYVISGDVELKPTAFGIEVGFNTPTIGASGPANIIPNRMRGIVVGFQPGLRLGATQKRQVALVGPDAETYRFTPEMTVGGTEGQFLAQHADRPPTWEDPNSSAFDNAYDEPVRFDSDGDGTADEFLLTDDGDVVVLKRYV